MGPRLLQIYQQIRVYKVSYWLYTEFPLVNLLRDMQFVF